VGSLTRRPAGDGRCAGVDAVTARELDVLRLVAQGQTSARIGTELGISERTVRFHLENLFDRLGVHNRTGAVATATRLGLISMNGPASGVD
jgi:DNA-binding CsgD family transcriptional regulator